MSKKNPFHFDNACFAGMYTDMSKISVSYNGHTRTLYVKSIAAMLNRLGLQWDEVLVIDGERDRLCTPDQAVRVDACYHVRDVHSRG